MDSDLLFRSPWALLCDCRSGQHDFHSLTFYHISVNVITGRKVSTFAAETFLYLLSHEFLFLCKALEIFVQLGEDIDRGTAGIIGDSLGQFGCLLHLFSAWEILPAVSGDEEILADGHFRLKVRHTASDDHDRAILLHKLLHVDSGVHEGVQCASDIDIAAWTGLLHEYGDVLVHTDGVSIGTLEETSYGCYGFSDHINSA